MLLFHSTWLQEKTEEIIEVIVRKQLKSHISSIHPFCVCLVSYLPKRTDLIFSVATNKQNAVAVTDPHKTSMNNA